MSIILTCFILSEWMCEWVKASTLVLSKGNCCIGIIQYTVEVKTTLRFGIFQCSKVSITEIWDLPMFKKGSKITGPKYSKHGDEDLNLQGNINSFYIQLYVVKTGYFDLNYVKPMLKNWLFLSILLIVKTTLMSTSFRKTVAVNWLLIAYYQTRHKSGEFMQYKSTTQ